MTLDERLAVIEGRAAEDRALFVSDDVDAYAEVDVPRLVKALREAIRVAEKMLDESHYLHENIAKILAGDAT